MDQRIRKLMTMGGRKKTSHIEDSVDASIQQLKDYREKRGWRLIIATRNYIHYWERLEYWEESWRLEESWCHSISSEKPSAYADVKNSNE